MKKLLIVLLVLVLMLGGLFFWKGGHHALFLAEALEEWMDADNADQSLTLQYQAPGFSSDDAGKLHPQMDQWSLSADTFWTEHGEMPVYGLSAAGCTAYLRADTLYMDTGRAYALPELSQWTKKAGALLPGLLLHGRVTKEGQVYQLSMNRRDLELRLSVTADPDIRAIHLRAVMSNGGVIQGTLTPKPTEPHPIPQEVLDAMVLSQMEPPMLLTEPLEILVPALQKLMPLEGALTLGVECGILNLAETVVLRIDQQKAELERDGVTVALDLPMDLSQAEPAALALLLLRNGSFTKTGEEAGFQLDLPADLTNQLCEALVPQISGLGIRFAESQVKLSFRSSSLTDVSMTAEGAVPFLITTIPVSFRAELHIP